jgi:perosamine synthetase
MNFRFHTIPRFGLPYTFADFTTALRAIFGDGPLPEPFGLFGDSAKFWTGSGRQALWLILRALNLGRSAGVAVPLFTDPSVASAIAAAGYQPIFIDVDSDTLTMDPKSLAAAQGMFSAVVAVHLFGHVADMPALLQAGRGVPIIEDTAHAPFSYLCGRMVGTFGEACFYSFASTKYWPAGGGGLAVIQDARLAGRVAAATASLMRCSRLVECQNILLQAAKAAVFSRDLYGVLGRVTRVWAERLALLEPSLDLKAIHRSQAAVASRQALRLPQRMERQRENSLRLLSLLSHAEGIVLPWERPRTRYNYHLFPVLLRDEGERKAVASAMSAHRVDTSHIYHNIIGHCRDLGYRGGCPVAESVPPRLMTLPNHASLPDKDLDSVADAFLRALEAWRSRPSAVSWRSSRPKKEVSDAIAGH